MTKNENVLLFVYGTLMSGYGNNVLLRGEKLVGTGETVNQYAMYGSGIPFVNDTKEVSRIKGELYEVRPSSMRSLDGLEGHPDWYERKEIPVTVNDQEYTAWLYFNNDNRGTLISDGDYRGYRNNL